MNEYPELLPVRAQRLSDSIYRVELKQAPFDTFPVPSETLEIDYDSETTAKPFEVGHSVLEVVTWEANLRAKQLNRGRFLVMTAISPPEHLKLLELIQPLQRT